MQSVKNQIKEMEKEQKRFKQKMTDADERETKILDSHNWLDPDRQNFAWADQIKDSHLHRLFNDWEREYTHWYNKMLDDRDYARAMCKQKAKRVQKQQIVETKEAHDKEMAEIKSLDKLLVLKDQESKLQ